MPRTITILPSKEEQLESTLREALEILRSNGVPVVAEYLRVHPSTIYRLLRQRKLPAFKVGSDWRFSREAIDHWRLTYLEPKQSGPAADHRRGSGANVLRRGPDDTQSCAGPNHCPDV